MSEKYEKFLFWLYILSPFVVLVLCVYFNIPTEIMVLIWGIVFGFTTGLIISADSDSDLDFLAVLFVGILCGIIAYFNVVWGLV